MLPTINFRKRVHRFSAVGIGVFAVTVLVVLLAAFKSTGPAMPRHLLLSSDSNGAPLLFHISLANTNVRNGVFRAMKAAGFRVWVAAPNGGGTNQTQISNFLETLQAVSREGLFATNSKTNPFE